MPQLLFLSAVVAAGVFGYRAFLKEAKKVSERVRREEREAETGAIGTLELDKDSGEYRVRREEE